MTALRPAMLARLDATLADRRAAFEAGEAVAVWARTQAEADCLAALAYDMGLEASYATPGGYSVAVSKPRAR